MPSYFETEQHQLFPTLLSSNNHAGALRPLQLEGLSLERDPKIRMILWHSSGDFATRDIFRACVSDVYQIGVRTSDKSPLAKKDEIKALSTKKVLCWSMVVLPVTF